MVAWERHLATLLLVEESAQFVVVSHVGMSRVASCQECSARRRTHRAARVELCEAHAFCRKPIDPRRTNTTLAIRADIAVAKVVCEHHDKIRNGGSALPGDCGTRTKNSAG
jgi:hypothetical protein